MFGSAVLDIAIGLIFVYVLLSLICTAINELIASLIAWRARNLAEGLRNLLNGPAHQPSFDGGVKTPAGGGTGALAQQFFDHPLIQGLYRRGRPPSYIPSRTFALALLDIVYGAQRPTTIEGIRKAVGDSAINEDLKKVLFVLVDDAANAVDTGMKLRENGVIDAQRLETAALQVRQNVEVWFNDSMERVAGWYKRKVQLMTLAVAAVVTLSLNVDTVAIVRALSVNSVLRESIVAQAQRLADQPSAVVILPGTTDGTTGALSSPPAAPSGATPATQDPAAATSAAFERLQKRIADLEGTTLPIGWDNESPWLTFQAAIVKLLGLLLTMAAASLGAPFWFDVLNKIVTIRSVGKAPEETPKPPKAIPRPADPTATPVPPTRT